MENSTDRTNTREGVRIVSDAIKDMVNAAVDAVDISTLNRTPIEKDTVNRIIEDEKASFVAHLQECREAHEAGQES